MENTNFSPRINAVADRVIGERLADIACDHAYISIRAVTNNRVNNADACDLSAASVNKARSNIKKFGLEQRIQAFISDGLAAIPAGSCDCAAIAGIGGRLMRDILLKDPVKTRGIALYILEPQSDAYCVRRTLHEIGFVIKDETIIKEETFYYPIIEAVPGTEKLYSDTEYIYGKVTLEKKHPALLEYLEKELAKYEKIKDNLPCGKTLPNFNKKLGSIKEALEWFR